MQTLAAIFGFLALAIVWWYRLRSVSRVARDVAVQVGKVRARRNANRFNDKTAIAPITAIDNPLIAAATLIYVTQSEEFVLGDVDEDVIKGLLLNLADKENVDAAIAYAKWVVLQFVDRRVAIDKLGVLLSTKLEEAEKRYFLELLSEANLEIGGCYDFKGTHARLAGKMGLATSH